MIKSGSPRWSVFDHSACKDGAWSRPKKLTAVVATARRCVLRANASGVGPAATFDYCAPTPYPYPYRASHSPGLYRMPNGHVIRRETRLCGV